MAAVGEAEALESLNERFAYIASHQRKRQEELDRLRQELADVRKNAGEDSSNARARYEAEIASLRKQLAQAQADISSKQVLIEQQKAELKELKKRAEEAEGTLHDVQHELIKAKHELAEAKETRKVAVVTAQTESERAERLAKELAEERLQRRSAVADLELERATVAGLREEILRLIAEHQHAEKELADALEQAKLKAQDDLQALRDELRAAEAEGARLKKEAMAEAAAKAAAGQGPTAEELEAAKDKAAADLAHALERIRELSEELLRLKQELLNKQNVGNQQLAEKVNIIRQLEAMLKARNEENERVMGLKNTMEKEIAKYREILEGEERHYFGAASLGEDDVSGEGQQQLPQNGSVAVVKSSGNGGGRGGEEFSADVYFNGRSNGKTHRGGPVNGNVIPFQEPRMVSQRRVKEPAAARAGKGVTNRKIVPPSPPDSVHSSRRGSVDSEEGSVKGRGGVETSGSAVTDVYRSSRHRADSKRRPGKHRHGHHHHHHHHRSRRHGDGSNRHRHGSRRAHYRATDEPQQQWSAVPTGMNGVPRQEPLGGTMAVTGDAKMSGQNDREACASDPNCVVM